MHEIGTKFRFPKTTREHIEYVNDKAMLTHLNSARAQQTSTNKAKSKRIAYHSDPSVFQSLSNILSVTLVQSRQHVTGFRLHKHVNY